MRLWEAHDHGHWEIWTETLEAQHHVAIYLSTSFMANQSMMFASTRPSWWPKFLVLFRRLRCSSLLCRSRDRKLRKPLSQSIRRIPQWRLLFEGTRPVPPPQWASWWNHTHTPIRSTSVVADKEHGFAKGKWDALSVETASASLDLQQRQLRAWVAPGEAELTGVDLQKPMNLS